MCTLVVELYFVVDAERRIVVEQEHDNASHLVVYYDVDIQRSVARIAGEETGTSASVMMAVNTCVDRTRSDCNCLFADIDNVAVVHIPSHIDYHHGDDCCGVDVVNHQPDDLAGSVYLQVAYN